MYSRKPNKVDDNGNVDNKNLSEIFFLLNVCLSGGREIG